MRLEYPRAPTRTVRIHLMRETRPQPKGQPKATVSYEVTDSTGLSPAEVREMVMEEMDRLIEDFDKRCAVRRFDRAAVDGELRHARPPLAFPFDQLDHVLGRAHPVRILEAALLQVFVRELGEGVLVAVHGFEIVGHVLPGAA